MPVSLVFLWDSERGASVSLTLPAVGIVFLLFSCRVQSWWEGFCLVLCIFFVVFGCCLWEACSFLKQDRAGVDSGQVSGRARGWEEWMEGKLGFGCNVLYDSRIYFQFKKKKRNVL